MLTAIMKKFTAAFFVMLGFAAFANAQVCTPAPVGLTSWWSGDGNALDSRSRNNGTLQNGATFTAGNIGQGFDFDGTNDFVSAPDTPSLRPTNLTVEGWFRFDNLTQSQVLISKAVGGTVNHSFVAFYTNTATPISFATGDASGLNPFTSSTFTPVIGEWNHFAFTFDDSTNTQRVFINGILSGTTITATLSIGYDSNVVNLGAANNTGPYANFLDGGIDEVSIYNRALSQAEIIAIHAAGTAGKCKPTATVAPSGQVGWWAGDGNANDIGGTGNGTLNGGAGFAVGRVGQTFRFDGVDDYVEVPDSPNLRITGTVTLEFWAKRNRLGLDLVLEKGGDWTLGQTNYGVGLHTVNNNMFYFFYAGGGKGVDGVSDLNWHHYAVVATNGQTNVDFYIDGLLRPVQHNFGSGTVNLNPSTLPLHIGAQVDGTFNTFGQNDIDELSIYNRGLSSTEIASIFNAGIAGKLKACVAPPANLVAWFPGDGNGNDIAAGNNATLLVADFASGKVGGAFSLNGVNQSVTAPQTATLSPSFTFDAWINPTSLATNPVVFERAFSINDRVGLQILSNGAIGGFMDAAGGFNVAAPAGTIVAGRFTHVAYVFDEAAANEAQIYVDGRLVASANDDRTPIGTAAPLVIGNSTVSLGADFFAGLIDELQSFNRALSPAEIQSIYNGDSSGKCKPDSPALASPNFARLGEATLTFQNVTQNGAHHVIPISTATLPPLPLGTHTGLLYDIATSAAFTGSPTVCFNLPSFTNSGVFADLRVMHLEAGVWQNRTTTSDFATRTLCAQVTSLSPFAIAQLAPTAAPVSISGRVTDASGRGIRGVIVSITGQDGTPRSAMTATSGRYRFAGLAAGETYVLAVHAKRYRFENPTRIITLTEDLANEDFTAALPETRFTLLRDPEARRFK